MTDQYAALRQGTPLAQYARSSAPSPSPAAHLTSSNSYNRFPSSSPGPYSSQVRTSSSLAQSATPPPLDHSVSSMFTPTVDGQSVYGGAGRKTRIRSDPTIKSAFSMQEDKELYRLFMM
ncbi:hypothetical protein RQP46_002023 [Phenoliferia psychrophenolica]